MSDLFSTKNKYKKEIKRSPLIEETISIGVLVRVSTDMQVEEGSSIEMQMELAKNREKEINGIIYKSYVEEGVSAKKVRIEKREAIQELMQDIRDGKINYLIAYKRDRMFRNTMEYIGFIQFLADHNVELYLSATGEQQVDLEAFKFSGASKMMEVVMSMVAEMESATTSTRVSDTMIKKAMDGYFTGGSLPIGYDFGDGNYKFKLIEGAKETIKLVEDLYLEGMGVMSIAKYLNGGKVRNKEQLSTPVFKPIKKEERTSEIWNHRNIQTILFNPMYTGHFSYDSKQNTEIDRIVRESDLIETCRTEETQRKINKLYESKSSNVSERIPLTTNFLLSGLVYCSECGTKMMTSTTQPKSTDRKFSYYSCRKKRSAEKNDCAHKTQYRKEVIERIVVDVAKQKIKQFLKPEIIEKAKIKLEEDKYTYHSEADKTEKDIKKLKTKLDNLTNLVAELDDDIELQVVYLKKQKALLNEMNELKEFHATLKDKAVKDEEDSFDLEEFIGLAEKFGDMFDVAPIGIKKQMLNNLFTNIYINKDGDIRMKLRLGLADINNISTSEDADTSQDVVEFIEVRTRGEALVIEDMNIFVSNDSPFDITINYFSELNRLNKQLPNKISELINKYDELANPKNAKFHYNKLTRSQKEKVKNKQEHMSLLYRKYLENHYGFTTHLSKKAIEQGFTYHALMKFLSHHIKEDNLLNDINSLIGLDIDKEVLEQMLHNKVKSKPNHRRTLFQSKIKCSYCGGNYRVSRRQNKTWYVCASKYRYKNNKCETPLTHMDEKDLLAKIRNNLNDFDLSDWELVKKVSKIVVAKNGDLNIYNNLTV